MKKITKIILSFCLTFIISFSLIACSNKNDDNKNNNTTTPTPTITLTQKALEIYQNPFTASSYIITNSEKVGNNTTISITKIICTENLIKFAYYDESLNLVQYVEIETLIQNSLYKMRNYDQDKNTYTETSYTATDLESVKLNMGCVESAIIALYPIEKQYGYEIGEVAPYYEENNYTLTESLSNISTDKFVLRRKAQKDDNSILFDAKLTYINNKIIKQEIETSESFTTRTYEYTDVTIDFDTSGFTKAEK